MYFRKQGISICQNPEGALKFLAWLWGSQENYLFCLYGEEDEDWKLDENGRLVTLSETARGDGYFYEWMFRNANYQVFSSDVSDEYIQVYRSWDNDAQISAMMGFAFDDTNVKAIQTACNAGLPCISVLWGFRDRDFLLQNGAETFISTPSELLL